MAVKLWCCQSCSAKGRSNVVGSARSHMEEQFTMTGCKSHQVVRSALIPRVGSLKGRIGAILLCRPPTRILVECIVRRPSGVGIGLRPCLLLACAAWSLARLLLSECCCCYICTVRSYGETAPLCTAPALKKTACEPK